MNYNILIIGFGNLGQRYLEGILKSNLDLKIHVVEKNEDLLKKLVNKKAEFYHDYKKIKERNFDLLINSTTADNRFFLIKQYNSYFNVKNFIIEKVLENNYNNLLSFENLKLENCWVNTFLRTLVLFKKIKSEIRDNSFNIKVIGGNWGLLCNSIHYIDLVSWLSGKRPSRIETKRLSNKFINSKRKGFVEIYGSLEVKFSDQIKLEIVCNDNEEDLKIEFKSDALNFDYNLIKGEYKTKFGTETHLIPYQSKMTKDLVENILINGRCGLTPLKESIEYHKFFLKHLLDEWNNMNGCQGLYIPIT